MSLVNTQLRTVVEDNHDYFFFSLYKFIGKNSVNEIPDVCYNLPNLETPSNEALQDFINALNEEKPFNPTVQIIR